MSEPAAWYGKLPALGDFASRRLGPGFIEPWDDWLASGMASWRETDPDGWLQAYLAAPCWRFVLEGAALAPAIPALAGVLMPSVDSVGRYFPLTLVTPADVGVPLLDWLARLEQLALGALHDDWRPERLESELAQLGGAPAAPGASARGAADAPAWAWPLLRAAQQPARRSWWWCTDADGATRLVDHAGLPPIAGLLAGTVPT